MKKPKTSKVAKPAPVVGPIPWARAKPSELRSVRGVCLDIDDTLTTQGKLTAEAFAALWALKDAGLTVVPITGRPAGWCDMIARFWPVDAVVGENGAFVFFMKDGVRRRVNTPGVLPDPGPKLAMLGEKIRTRFPLARWASDQKYREYDLAIDICEDVEPWRESDVEDLLALCAREGAHAKLSSIHVNAWFGDYDKRLGFENWLAQGCPGVAGKVPPRESWVFIGDSPNDEPMFACFERSVGVANLKKYLSRLKYPPRWITRSESGGGFAEMSRKLAGAGVRKKRR